MVGVLGVGGQLELGEDEQPVAGYEVGEWGLGLGPRPERERHDPAGPCRVGADRDGLDQLRLVPGRADRDRRLGRGTRPALATSLTALLIRGRLRGGRHSVVTRMALGLLRPPPAALLTAPAVVSAALGLGSRRFLRRGRSRVAPPALGVAPPALGVAAAVAGPPRPSPGARRPPPPGLPAPRPPPRPGRAISPCRRSSPRSGRPGRPSRSRPRRR